METLGLSESTPRSEGRLKTLLWPSVESASDVDYLGTQGFWVCTFIGLLSWAVLTFLLGQWLVGLISFLVFFLGGVGIRERSRYAATYVFIFYLVDTFASGFGLVRFIVLALLLANVRAIFIAAEWKPSDEAATPPPRLGETVADKLSDRLPLWLWPKIRILYYIFSAGVMLLVVFAMLAAALDAGVESE